MKEKIAREIVKRAKKAACKSVGKSFPLGVHEITPPSEFISQRKHDK